MKDAHVWDAELSKNKYYIPKLTNEAAEFGETAFIRTNIGLLGLFRKQTTGITFHYLQARLRNILQEEGISSRFGNPPCL